MYQDVKGNRYFLYPETETQRKTLLPAKMGLDITENLPLEVSCDPACGASMINELKDKQKYTLTHERNCP